MSTYKTLLLAIFFTPLIACGGDRASLAPLPVEATVLAFGDSLTAGYGVNTQQSYPAVLAELAVLNVINAGISGELSVEGVLRLPGLLTQYNPRLVVLCHGGNDLLRNTGIAGAKSNVLAMIEMIRASGAQVLLLGVPQPGIFLSAAEFYTEIAEQTGVAYIPQLIPQVLSDATLKSDVAHPNAAGYQMIAEQIQRYLIRAGAL